MKERFRVVAYGLPLSWSYRSVSTERNNPGLFNLYENHIEPLVAQVLGEYNISIIRTDLQYWYLPNEKSKGQETFIVDTSDINTESWSVAASALLDLFAAKGARTFVTEMQVEIRNPKEMYYDCSYPLPQDETLLAALAQIEQPIFDTVSAFFGDTWSSIAYHMRVSRMNQNSPQKPTVIVFCYPGASCVFEQAEDQVMRVLDQIPVKIYLEILAGEITLADGEPLYLDNITSKPSNGASISIKGNTDRVGTLGGWVMLNLPKENKRIPCALTCYHVIRASDDSIANYTDINGIRHNDPCGQVEVEYPAALDAKQTMKTINTILQNGHSERVKSQQAILSSRISTPGIGKVIYASGHQIKNGQRLDWAIIESPDTFTPNKPPARSKFNSIYKTPSDMDYSQNDDSRVRNFGRAKKGDWVAKTGRTTGLTSGIVNRMDRRVQWEPGKTTVEVELMSPFGDIVASGDSGSIVTNAQGEMVGIIIGKDSDARHFDIGIMTPVALIQQHVKEMTNGGFLSLD